MAPPVKGTPGAENQPYVAKKRLGEVLVEMGKLLPEQLVFIARRAEAQGIRFADLLIAEKVISETDLAQALALQHEVPFRDLHGFRPSSLAVQHLPEKVVKRFLILPVEVRDQKLVICVHNPIDVEMLDLVQRIIKMPVLLNISPKQQLVRAIEECFSSEPSVENLVEKLQQQEMVRQGAGKTIALAPASASVEELVNRFLDEGVRNHASDIHIDPSETECRVRMRIDGILREMHRFPIDLHPSVVSRIKVLGEMDIAERRNAQDGRFEYRTNNSEIDLRISTLPTIHGEKVVLRILNKRSQNKTLAEVGMNAEMIECVGALMEKPHGIVFLTGPTGSGKTTSLYAMLNLVDAVERNIITVEDPVEFTFDLVNQVQVNERAGVTFPTILRNILRQDPDVMMVGEVRDSETADIAVRAAMTGHLVLTTLHTNDAVSTISRLIDMKVEPFLLSSALLAVIAQRLVRKLCLACRKEVRTTSTQFAALGDAGLAGTEFVYAPQGCEECNQTGYRGRLALFEMMNIDSALRHAINVRSSELEILSHLRKLGFYSLREDGVQKIRAGLTSVEEIVKVTG